MLKCQQCWDDVQCLCLTKVCSRSKSEFKIKHCMTYLVKYCWLPLNNNPLSHVAHGVFITFCGSSSLRFHLPLHKKIDFIQWHTGGDMIAFVSESTRLVFVTSRGRGIWLSYECRSHEQLNPPSDTTKLNTLQFST